MRLLSRDTQLMAEIVAGATTGQVLFSGLRIVQRLLDGSNNLLGADRLAEIGGARNGFCSVARSLIGPGPSGRRLEYPPSRAAGPPLRCRRACLPTGYRRSPGRGSCSGRETVHPSRSRRRQPLRCRRGRTPRARTLRSARRLLRREPLGVSRKPSVPSQSSGGGTRIPQPAGPEEKPSPADSVMATDRRDIGWLGYSRSRKTS